MIISEAYNRAIAIANELTFREVFELILHLQHRLYQLAEVSWKSKGESDVLPE